MAKFIYKNAKNTGFGYTLFKLNCSYHFSISYKKVVNSCSKFKLANKLLAELKKVIIVCKKNLYYIQKFQRKTYNKSVKPKIYASSNKNLLNIKYIKTKQNQKLKAKLFKLFQILHFVRKQSYKLELSKK